MCLAGPPSGVSYPGLSIIALCMVQARGKKEKTLYHILFDCSRHAEFQFNRPGKPLALDLHESNCRAFERIWASQALIYKSYIMMLGR